MNFKIKRVMFSSFCYKDLHDDLLSLRYMQVSNNYESDSDPIDEDNFQLLITKIHQIYTIKKIDDAQSIIDTIKNLIQQDPTMANVLIDNDFNSLFNFLIEMNTNVFYCSLYDLLSELFLNYKGDFDIFVSQNVLIFLNMLSDENSHIFISNLKCVRNLLARNKAYKHFFIENGGFFRLLSYEIHENILEDKIILIFDIISMILEVQNENDPSNDYISSIQEQDFLLSQIYQSLSIQSVNVKKHVLTCLDYFIRASLLFRSIISEDRLLIYNNEKLDQIKTEVMKNIRLYDEDIVVLCIDIIILIMRAFSPKSFDIGLIQEDIMLIFNAFKNSYYPIIYSFKLLIQIANNIEVNTLISDEIISVSIFFCESDAFSIKIKSVHFLSILIQMTSNLYACSIIEKHPDIIEIFNDFLHTKDKILDCVISSLGKIVDLSREQKISISPFQIFQIIDIGFIKELQLNYEEDKDNLRILNLLSGIRYLVNTYDNLAQLEEN